jgi:hypothetical protein
LTQGGLLDHGGEKARELISDIASARLMENNSQIYQQQGVFITSTVAARHRRAECAIGGRYGVGYRRLGIGRGFGDWRGNLRHFEKVIASFRKKRGAKPAGSRPLITKFRSVRGALIF